MQELLKNTKTRILLLWFVLGLLLLEGIKEKATGIIGASSKPALDVVFAYVYYAVCFLLIVRMVKKAKGEFDLRGFIGRPQQKIRWFQVLFISLSLLMFSLGFLVVLSYFISSLIPESGGLYGTSELAWYKAAMFINLALVAPIVEEMIFRGVLLNRYSAKWGVTKGILVSSVIFALLHPAGMIGVFVFAVMASCLYMKYKSLVPGMICHVINNSLIGGMSLFATSSSQTASSTVPQSDLYYGLIMLVISFPFLIYYFRKFWPKKQIQTA